MQTRFINSRQIVIVFQHSTKTDHDSALALWDHEHRHQ
ncbi:Uncharacterised protein [Vibrio cholerae]|nr:Uncharacterised protein [Vibrio cholerae]